MNKRILSVFVLLLIALFTILFIIKWTQDHSLSLVSQLPGSKPHLHETLDGRVVEHKHFYNLSDSKNEVSSEGTTLVETDYMKMNPVQRAWAQLELAEMKRKWQLYTIEQMHEMWLGIEVPSTGHPNYKIIGMDLLDKMYPRDEWLQRYMDLGFPFHQSWHYGTALAHRGSLKKHQEDIEKDPDYWREFHFSGVSLPAHATWEEYEDTYMKYQVLSVHSHDQYYRNNPDSEAAGGVYMLKSGFIPFNSDTVYVHVSEEGPVSCIIGPTLTEEEEDALTMFGIAPRGMEVIYTDKDGVPLPLDKKPRFYERAMAQLESAEQQIRQQIADHDLFFKGKPSEKGLPLGSVPDVSSDDQEHWSDAELSTHWSEAESFTKGNRKKPVQTRARQMPSLPSAQSDPDQYQQWFEELRILHGGDLPEDLQMLQFIIKELGMIRKQRRSNIPSETPPLSTDRPVPPLSEEKTE